MAEALAEADQGRFWASPNPAVGCLVVSGDQVLGRGFTQPAGQAHAEIMALGNCSSAKGATVYVTLEPCAHQGRTGPCVEALIAAGVARVVIAIEDPDPRVAGAGIVRLREAGIAVTVGVGAREAAWQMAGFLLRMQRGWGRVRLKLACSLDGRTAMASGESQWITGAEARSDVQRLRAASSVILTGIGTVLADDCSLTVRSAELGLAGDELQRALHRMPERAVLDSCGRTPVAARILQDGAKTTVFTAAGYGGPSGAEHKVVAHDDSGLDLRGVLQALGETGANEILVEAGSTLAGAFMRSGLVDELVIYQAPVLLGTTAQPLLNVVMEELAEGIQLAYREVSPLGPDLRIIASLRTGT